MGSIEVFLILMGLAVAGASVAACVTKNLDAFCFPIIFIICYLTCGEIPNTKEPAAQQPTNQGVSDGKQSDSH